MILDSDSRQLDESDISNKNSNSLQVWSSTIQILLPVAALAFIWGRRGLLTRFFLRFDKNCMSVICPSLKERQKLLQWIERYLPATWFDIKNLSLEKPIHFWQDGSLLCSLINSFIPDACPNPRSHRHHSPSHGQVLAYKYLGIAPIFTDLDLTKNTLSDEQEQELSDYLQQIREVCEKEWKPISKYSSNYIAKGMGLVSGEENRKMYFYIYVNSFDFLNANDIIINIRAPNNTYETLSIPSNSIKEKLFPHLFTKKFTYQSESERLLLKPIIDLAPYIETNETQHINENIPISFLIEGDRVKVVYIPRCTGIYEVSIITNGCHILGSPFPVSILENTSSVYDNIEDLNSFPTVTIKKTIKRTILSQDIDFVDENPPNKTFAFPQVNGTFEENIGMNDHNVNNSDIYLAKYVTSPICEDHIEYEVPSNLQSSSIPYRNREKTTDDKIINSTLTASKEAHTLNKLNIENSTSNENDIDCNTSNNGLNILNYLPHLKYDRSVSCNELNQNNRSSSPTMKSVGDDGDHYFEFKEKLSFWENQSNLQQRISLPDLLLGSNAPYIDYNDKFEFKSKQGYWKFLSSQTIDCIANTSFNSLPNIFDHVENDTAVRNRRNANFDSIDFKNKFKECREFWERMSSRPCSNEYLYSEHKVSSELTSRFNDNNTSFARDGSKFELDMRTSDHSTFEERQNFWKTLNKHKVNREAEDSERITPHIRESIPQEKLGNYARKEKYLFHEITFSNLTDDFKCVSGTRENMRLRFCKNKDFFRSLESNIR
ncbi:hypothetical protein RI129_001769 [Pyrocoelia pectoralis]|uniref:Uncharacterized protein n=1 Tax=Pyrocoelia pectoralis TaxID=417401 RepID=A0AAN7VK55_9COLE